MSGICGVVSLDGAPVDLPVLRRMAEAAAHLGPDGIHYWTEGVVGFAYLALHTTAESLREQQPLLARQGQLALVADARVDNRDELISTLTAKGYLQGRDPTDADLILAAYEAWGDECPYHLLGDFAFALWDGRAQRLLCARDPFGVRPLFYFVNHQVFLFSSMARQVLAHGAAPVRLNERAIAYYLTGAPYDFLTEGTYFKGIRRVRPAHKLALTSSAEPRQTRYWDIDRTRQLRYNGDHAYAEELLHLLEQSVKAHSRSQRPVAVFTSGGMDSASIASLQGKLRERGQGADFKLISFVYGQGHAADESEYISTIARRYGIDAHYIDGLQHLPFSAFPDVGRCNDEPPHYWNDPVWHAGFKQAAQFGCRAALLGQGGDCLFITQQAVFGDLLRQGRLLECIREIQAAVSQYGGVAASAICKQLIQAGTPRWLRKLYRSVRGQGALAWFNPDFVRPLATSAPELKWGFPDYGFRFAHQAARYYAISDWLYPVEAAIHSLATPYGLEARDPYLDRRLVEFAFALPAEQFYHRGVTKRVLRNATMNSVPEAVRLRRTITIFDTVLRQGLIEWVTTGAQGQAAEWISVQRGYINAQRLSETWQAFGSAPTDRVAKVLWKPILLEEWLRSIRSILVK